MTTQTEYDVDETTRADLGAIELNVMQYSLADAIREGSAVTEQKCGGWGDGVTNACAMTAAVVAARKRGYMQ